jgi:hypothetical protein
VMPRRWSTLRVCLGERPLKKVKGHSRAPWWGLATMEMAWRSPWDLLFLASED